MQYRMRNLHGDFVNYKWKRVLNLLFSHRFRTAVCYLSTKSSIKVQSGGGKSPKDKHVGRENAIMHLHALAFACYAFRLQNVAVIATPPTKFQEYL